MTLDIGKEVLSIIENEGYKAYLVGGCVRDYLLNIDINDQDITTNMPLDKISKLFDVIDNGSKYLSITIIYKEILFEITNFRKDILYKDHRHPDVLFVDNPKEDSLRRDYTINALYMDKNGKILDFHDGLNDLTSRKLKMIGEANLRFEEDALRILRGLYFSSKLNFEIDNNTIDGMVLKKKLLKYLSEERLYQYFVKIIYAKGDLGIKYINEFDLFEYIPIYKKWLSIFNPLMKEKDLIYYYYLKYDEFPITVSNEIKKSGGILKGFLKSLDSYNLYCNKDLYFKFKDILKYYGCDIIGADNKVSNFAIKSDKDLAVKKEEIASFYDAKEKSIHIELVKEAILNGKIKNKREEIIKLLGCDINV